MNNYSQSDREVRYMSIKQRTITTLLSGAFGLAMSAGAITAHSQAATAIYPGGSPVSAGITISNSGSGSLTPDTTHVFSGGGSLKLVTHGLFQGGIIDLNKPYNLASL